MNGITKLNQSTLPDLEKLAQVYRRTTSKYIEDVQRQAELLQAMGARDEMIKEQIKLGVMEMAQEMFEACFNQVTGKRAWSNEQKS